MDLIKIGKYIAGKRKSLGMTQKQLAEKIGMSDKFVSKWERGVSQTKGY
ncbi:helix-turn-helix domain-containing protein [Ruminococcus sp.]